MLPKKELRRYMTNFIPEVMNKTDLLYVLGLIKKVDKFL